MWKKSGLRKVVMGISFSVGVSTKDENALQFLYENHENFSPLPTFGIVPSQRTMMDGSLFQNIPGWTINPTKVSLVHKDFTVTH